MRLFFFGTLMDPDLFAIVVGRSLDAFEQSPARLHGHAARHAEGESFPMLVADADARTEGLLVTGLTDAEVERCHFFEGEDYQLTPIDVVVGETGITAHAYFSSGILPVSNDPWCLDDWQRLHKPLALFESRAFMARWGVVPIEHADNTWDAIKEEAWAAYQRALAAGQ